MQKKILPLESIRGIAALSVSLIHFWTSSPLSQNPFVQHSDLMVDFFFVLSGFVIAMSYFDKISNFADLVKFQTKRFWRLYPLHLLTLFGFLGIEFIKYYGESYMGISGSTGTFSNNNMFAFINNVFLTHALFLDGVTFNYPSWSISTEFYTYLVFALVMLTGRFYFKLGISILIMLGAFVFLLMNDPTFEVYNYRFFRCLYSFFMGVIGYKIFCVVRIKTPDIVALLFLVLSVLSVCFIAKTDMHIFIPIIFLLTVLSLSYASTDGWLTKILSVRPLVYLGTISYSIYMVHAGVWWGITQTLRFIFKVPSFVDEGRVRLILDPVPATLITLFGLCVILLVSHLTYKFIEDRFRKGIKGKNN